MPFHRFEGLKSYRFNPHLSTAEGPVIEGEYLYFRLVTKRAGTGAELHYHPNELMAFPLKGKVDCYYPMIDSLDAPPASGHCERWVEGTHIAFGFVESPPGRASWAAR